MNKKWADIQNENAIDYKSTAKYWRDICESELEKGNTAAACFAHNRATANEEMILEDKNENSH